MTVDNLHPHADWSPTNRRTPVRKSFSYVGSYAKLTQFIKDCTEKGCEKLGEEKSKELLEAVEDLSRGPRHSLKLDDPHFRGHELFTPQVLSSWGIAINDDDPVEALLGAESPRASDSRKSSICDDPSSTCGSRLPRPSGNVAEEILLLSYAFTSPIDLVNRHQIQLGVLASWIMAIAEQYLANPYHNWGHACDVFIFTYFSLTRGEACQHFIFLDMLALLLAAIAHDVGHVGVNNHFITTTRSKLATIYNDQSPLENMHASIFFTTLQKPGLDFLSTLSESNYKNLRSMVVEAILSTDMEKHFGFVDKFAARVSEKEKRPFPGSPEKEERDRDKGSERGDRLLVQAFLHMADLGSCCRRWEVHKYMVVMLEEEFFAQGDKEREMGIPIMPMMDRRKDSIAAGQGFFLEKLVYPLLEPYLHFISEDVAHSFQENLWENKRRWSELLERHGSNKSAARLVELEDAA